MDHSKVAVDDQQVSVDGTDRITILRAADGRRANKAYELRDGVIRKVRDHDQGYSFYMETRAVPSLEALFVCLRELAADKSAHPVLGEPLRLGGPQRRLSAVGRGDERTLYETPRSYIPFDFDKVPFPGELPWATPGEIARFLRSLLPSSFWGAPCVLAYTGSHGLAIGDGPAELRARLWFRLSRPLNPSEMKTWLQEQRAIDRAIYQAGQPIYTAAPDFDGFDDPFPQRAFLIDGYDGDVVEVPDVIEQPVKRAAGSATGTRPARLDSGGRGWQWLLWQGSDETGFREGIKAACGSFVSTNGAGADSSEFEADVRKMLEERALPARGAAYVEQRMGQLPDLLEYCRAAQRAKTELVYADLPAEPEAEGDTLEAARAKVSSAIDDFCRAAEAEAAEHWDWGVELASAEQYERCLVQAATEAQEAGATLEGLASPEDIFRGADEVDDLRRRIGAWREFEPHPSCDLIKVTAGVGKSQAALSAAGRFLLRGPRRRAATIVPSHDLAAELRDRFAREFPDIPVIVLHGVSRPDSDRPGEAMCRRADLAAEVFEAGGALKDLCGGPRSRGGMCPHHKDYPGNGGGWECGYRAQEERAGDARMVIFAGPECLTKPVAESLRRQPETVVLEDGGEAEVAHRQFDLIIIDEPDPTRMFDGIDGDKGISLEAYRSDKVFPVEGLDLNEDETARVAGAELAAAPLAALMRERLRGEVSDPGPVTHGELRRHGLHDLGSLRKITAKLDRARLAPHWNDAAGPCAARQAHGRRVKELRRICRAALGAHRGRNREESELYPGLYWDTAKTGGVTAAVLHCRWLERRHEDWWAPTLVLDATPEVEALKELMFPSLRTRLECVVEPRAGAVFVRQVCDKPVSHRAMREGGGEAWTASMARYLEIRLAQHGRLLGVVPKEAVALLRGYWGGEPPQGLDLLHHGAVRGIDRFRDVPAMSDIGRILPPVKALEDMVAVARGYYGNQVVQYERRPAKWRMRGGGTAKLAAATVEEHPDSLVEALRRMKCEWELEQAIARGRGVTRTADTPLNVDVVTNMPTPETRVDELVTLNDLTGAHAVRPLLLAAARGVIFDDLAAKGALDVCAAVVGLDSGEAVRGAERRATADGHDPMPVLAAIEGRGPWFPCRLRLGRYAVPAKVRGANFEEATATLVAACRLSGCSAPPSTEPVAVRGAKRKRAHAVGALIECIDKATDRVSAHSPLAITAAEGRPPAPPPPAAMGTAAMIEAAEDLAASRAEEAAPVHAAPIVAAAVEAAAPPAPTLAAVAPEQPAAPAVAPTPRGQHPPLAPAASRVEDAAPVHAAPVATAGESPERTAVITLDHLKEFGVDIGLSPTAVRRLTEKHRAEERLRGSEAAVPLAIRDMIAVAAERGTASPAAIRQAARVLFERAAAREAA